MGDFIKQALINRIDEAIEETEVKINLNDDTDFNEGIIDGLIIALNIIRNEF